MFNCQECLSAGREYPPKDKRVKERANEENCVLAASS